jgi:hypothetical protein
MSSKKSPIDGILARIQRQPELPEHQRVRRIVDLIMTLARLQPEMLNGPFEIAEDELHCILSAYQWDAAVLFDKKSGCVRIGFQPRTKTSMWERDAVLALMEANPYFIRRCTGKSGKCKGLFYATRSTNTTCSRACISARYDGDPVKYEARLKTQRANHKVVKDQQYAAAKRALPAGHVNAKRARADHRTKTDSESWLEGAGNLIAAGNLRSDDRKTVRAVGKAINQALWQDRKIKRAFVPDVAFITRGELAKKLKGKL